MEQGYINYIKRLNDEKRIIEKAINTIELEQANKTPSVHIVEKIKNKG